MTPSGVTIEVEVKIISRSRRTFVNERRFLINPVWSSGMTVGRTVSSLHAKTLRGETGRYDEHLSGSLPFLGTKDMAGSWW